MILPQVFSRKLSGANYNINYKTQKIYVLLHQYLFTLIVNTMTVPAFSKADIRLI